MKDTKTIELLMKDAPEAGSGHFRHQKQFFIAQRCGRLANRLVLFAHFAALAEEQGDRVVNFTFHSYAHLFETTRRDIYCRYPAAQRRSWLDLIPGLAPALRKTRLCYHIVRAVSAMTERFPIFGKTAVILRETPGEMTLLDGTAVQDQIRDARIVFVHGWRLCAPQLVQRHAPKIREYFRPVPEVEQASRRAVDLLRQNADVVVGVHVRQGDYRGWRGGKFFFPVAQYAAWMREFAGQFPGKKVAFCVCSDESRTPDEFTGLTVGFGPGFPAGDLFALARCDYIFGPASTFTQWASFYGGKPLFQLWGSNDRLELGKFDVSYLKLPTDRELGRL